MTKPIQLTSLARACAAITLAFGLAATSSEATTLTLQDLLNGQTVVVGHVEFANFRNFASTGTDGAAPINPSEILVTVVLDGFHLGLAFEGAAFGAQPGQSKQWSFDFDGIVISEGPLIAGASAWIAEAMFDGPGGVISSLLRIEPLGQPGHDVFVRRTFDDRTREYMEVILSNTLVSSFKVSGTTDIPTESLSLNFAKIEIAYTMQTPEPATLTLVGLGMIGLLLKGRRLSG